MLGCSCGLVILCWSLMSFLECRVLLVFGGLVVVVRVCFFVWFVDLNGVLKGVFFGGMKFGLIVMLVFLCWFIEEMLFICFRMCVFFCILMLRVIFVLLRSVCLVMVLLCCLKMLLWCLSLSFCLSVVWWIFLGESSSVFFWVGCCWCGCVCCYLMSFW